MIHLRAYRGTDTALTLWIRDEAGKRDLSGLDLSLEISQYGRSCDPLVTVEAASAEDGKLTATLTADTADGELGPGLFRVDAIGDDETLAVAMLEVV